jgi:riboflavin kinase/FMN adenylyltransferase
MSVADCRLWMVEGRLVDIPHSTFHNQPMIIEQGLDALRRTPRGSVMSVGNFDGVHLGHRRILVAAREAAAAEIVVVTFEPHPLTVLRPALAPPQLSSPQLKHSLLASLGVHRLIILPPSADVLGTTAEAFYNILRDETRVAHLVEGNDFNFGKGRGGNIDRLRDWCARDELQLTVVEDVSVTLSDRSSIPVSSSITRWLIAHGRVADAALCLARPYQVEGVVVGGEKRGRTIGFPTANISSPEAPTLLADGVYAGRCRIDGEPYAVALSVGSNPTFNGPAVTVEAYLLDFAGDLYGRALSVEVVAWVRDQEKFPSVQTLVEQLHRDVARVREMLVQP